MAAPAARQGCWSLNREPSVQICKLLLLSEWISVGFGVCGVGLSGKEFSTLSIAWFVGFSQNVFMIAW